MPDFSDAAIRRALEQTPTPAVDTAERTANHGIGPWPYIAMTAADVADSATTWDAIRDGRGREGNPLLLSDPATIALVKLALLIPQLLGVRALSGEHPKLAKGLAYGSAALSGAVAARNTRAGR